MVDVRIVVDAFAPFMVGVARDMRAANSRAVQRVGEKTRDAYRAQVLGAGLGQRLANAVRLELYPANRDSINKAAYVYTKAPRIVQAFAEGATIKPTGGRSYLAIPTAFVGQSRRNRGGGVKGARTRMTPAEAESAYDGDLKFVSFRGKPALAIEYYKFKGRLRRAKGERRLRMLAGKGLTEFDRTMVVLYWLVPQSRMPKKLDIKALEGAALDALPQALVEEIAKSSPST